MAIHQWITAVLLGLSALICLICAIGLVAFRDAYQRMHMSSPITALAMFAITVAVFIEDSSAQARIKTVLIGLILFLMNSILTHATAKALRIRSLDRWEVKPDERLPLVGEDGKVKGTVD